MNLDHIKAEIDRMRVQINLQQRDISTSSGRTSRLHPPSLCLKGCRTKPTSRSGSAIG